LRSKAVHPLIGHQAARERLAQAHAAGRLPQVLLLTGAAGIGKQRLALWLAQLVVCERSGNEPCENCRSCRLVGALSHPDVHWFVPIPRPRASDPDKQVEEAADSLAQVLEQRRAQPLYHAPDGMSIHGMATARLLLRRAALTSVEGGRRIFILGDADRLVPQESSPDAANALLKLLEEPPPGSLFILTTSDARRLLPTVRSRAVSLRLGGLADSEIRDFLRTSVRPALSPTVLDQRVAVAEGSIGRALASGEDAGRSWQAAHRWLEAVLAGPGPAMEGALRQPPWSARGDFTAMLDALTETLGEAARAVVGRVVRREIPEPLKRYPTPDPLLRAIEHVADAREAAWGNVNPQLLLAVLGNELAETL
jgi:DNA polymerase III subunit delta'